MGNRRQLSKRDKARHACLGFRKRNAPPRTVRMCAVCKKITKFKYNRFIGHSECEECGKRSISL